MNHVYSYGSCYRYLTLVKGVHLQILICNIALCFLTGVFKILFRLTMMACVLSMSKHCGVLLIMYINNQWLIKLPL